MYGLVPAIGRDHAAIRLGGGVDDRQDRRALVVAAGADGAHARRSIRWIWTTPRTRVSTDHRRLAASMNASAAGRPGSASQASGARRGRSDSSRARWRARRGRRRRARGRTAPARRARPAPPSRPPPSRRARRSASRCARPASALRRRRPWRARRRPHARRRCSAPRARSRARRRAGRGAPPVELARERHAASPEHGPVRRDRRPLDGARVRQLGGLVGLQHAELAARQLDRLTDQLVGHARATGSSWAG